MDCPIIGRVSIIYAPTIRAPPLDSGDMRNYGGLFLIYYFANIVLLKLLTARKQWWTEICASQSSGGRQY
jgi:hypothetical protein